MRVFSDMSSSTFALTLQVIIRAEQGIDPGGFPLLRSPPLSPFCSLKEAAIHHSLYSALGSSRFLHRIRTQAPKPRSLIASVVALRSPCPLPGCVSSVPSPASNGNDSGVPAGGTRALKPFLKRKPASSLLLESPLLLLFAQSSSPILPFLRRHLCRPRSAVVLVSIVVVVVVVVNHRMLLS